MISFLHQTKQNSLENLFFIEKCAILIMIQLIMGECHNFVSHLELFFTTYFTTRSMKTEGSFPLDPFPEITRCGKSIRWRCRHYSIRIGQRSVKKVQRWATKMWKKKNGKLRISVLLFKWTFFIKMYEILFYIWFSSHFFFRWLHNARKLWTFLKSSVGVLKKWYLIEFSLSLTPLRNGFVVCGALFSASWLQKSSKSINKDMILGVK
jgi:hypothetical protein